MNQADKPPSSSGLAERLKSFFTQIGSHASAPEQLKSLIGQLTENIFHYVEVVETKVASLNLLLKINLGSFDKIDQKSDTQAEDLQVINSIKLYTLDM